MTSPVIEYDPVSSAVDPWRTVTRWLVVINVAVFIIDMGLVMTHHARPMLQHDGTPIVRQRADGTADLIGQFVI